MYEAVTLLIQFVVHWVILFGIVCIAYISLYSRTIGIIFILVGPNVRTCLTSLQLQICAHCNCANVMKFCVLTFTIYYLLYLLSFPLSLYTFTYFCFVFSKTFTQAIFYINVMTNIMV